MKTLKELLDEVNNDYPVYNYTELRKKPILISVSFVVPVYNSAKTILYTLRSIEAQSLIKNIIDVIIIDDASSDDTKNVITNYILISALKITYLSNKVRKYAAFSRNRGIKTASGDVICFIDSDIILPPDFLEYHLSLHQNAANVISLSLRSNIEKEDYDLLQSPFPIETYQDEFRIHYSAKRKDEYFDNDQFKLLDRDIFLIKESDGFRKIKKNNFFWTLPELCLTHSICYKKKDLVYVKGAPENFEGWGFNDTSMAAKVISLGRKVIPIIQAGVYHCNHPSRTGDKKNNYYKINRIKYNKMLLLPQVKTFKYYIEELNDE